MKGELQVSDKERQTQHDSILKDIATTVAGWFRAIVYYQTNVIFFILRVNYQELVGNTCNTFNIIGPSSLLDLGKLAHFCSKFFFHCTLGAVETMLCPNCIFIQSICYERLIKMRFFRLVYLQNKFLQVLVQLTLNEKRNKADKLTGSLQMAYNIYVLVLLLDITQFYAYLLIIHKVFIVCKCQYCKLDLPGFLMEERCHFE